MANARNAQECAKSQSEGFEDRRRKWANPSGSRTYFVWRSMRDRCRNPRSQAYGNYGGRGIGVCDRWFDSYDSFVEDMGFVPDGLTLDRINVDGDYEPKNCRWVGWDVQFVNKRTNRNLTHKGRTQTASQWAAEIGVGQDTLNRRLNVYGMDVARALTPGSLVPETRCGTRHGYEKGCRCAECKAAHAKRHRDMRARRKAKITCGGEIATARGDA